MMKQTGADYVKCVEGWKKFYRAVLSVDYRTLRLSRSKFQRASDAVEYRKRFMRRQELVNSSSSENRNFLSFGGSCEGALEKAGVDVG